MAGVARMMDSVARLRAELNATGASTASTSGGAGLPMLKGAASGPAAAAASSAAATPLDAAEKESLSAEVHGLKEDLDRRQAAYIKKEREYRAKVEFLEHRLAESRAARDVDDGMDRVRDLHKNILSRVEQVQSQTGRILHEQEKDLLRAFRARLFDVQTELDKAKSKTEDSSATWVERVQQLEKELDWAREMADRLDRHNQSLTRENTRLKTQFKTQEDDRDYLIRQLVAVKKDNARLRQEITSLREEAEALKAAANDNASALLSAALPMTIARPRSSGMSGAGATSGKPVLPAVSEEKYRDVIMRLKKLLDTERVHLQQARASLASELHSRTELEIFLRQCVEDVRHDIARKRADVLGAGPGGGAGGSPARGGEVEAGGAGVSLSDFSTSDRERVLELLLSQERVVNLLYSKTFPSV